MSEEKTLCDLIATILLRRHPFFGETSACLDTVFLTCTQGMESITSLEPKAFTAYLSDTHNTICGRHPIAVLLNVSKQKVVVDWKIDRFFCLIYNNIMTCTQAVEDLRSSQANLECSLKFVQYAQSNKCKSTSDSSVSYASASLTITSK